MEHDVRLIITVDPYGGRGVFTKANTENGYHLAENLGDFLREEIDALFLRASQFSNEEAADLCSKISH